MSFSINLSGYKQTESDEELEAFETALAESVKTFVSEHPDITFASGSFQKAGSVNLLPEVEASAE
jgi:hypothetical protein